MTGAHPRRHDRFTVDRRRFLRLSLTASGAALAPGLLAGCGAPAPGGDGVGLKIWDLFSGGDGLLMDEMMDTVRGGPDGFTLDRTILEWGPSYYTKLAMAAAGGRAPDVAVLHLSRMPGYAPGGLLDPFDLELLAEFGITREDFPPALWERAQWEGRLYAVPLDTHPFIVFYDLDVAERAGVLDGAGRLIQPGSPGAMLETSAALAEAHGGAGLLFGHVTDPAQNWRIFNALYAQTGAAFDLPESGPAIDTDAAVRVVAFLQELFDGRTNPNHLDYFGALASFTESRGAMIAVGEWELPTLRSTGIRLGAAPFVNVFGEPAVATDSHSYVLPRQERPDPARRREAHRYVAAMLRQSLTWAGAGHLPAYQPVLAEPGYAELDPQSSYTEAGDLAVLDPPAWFAGSGSLFQDRMSQAIQPALLGRASAEAAVDRMVRECADLLDQPNPVR